MINVTATEKIPIKSWCTDIEDGALEQARNLANLPFAFKHIALMPDCHQGYGMPIGGVMATQGVIVPNAVGVDIGCGMRALRTNLTDLSTAEIKKIIGAIRHAIPVGFNHHEEPQEWVGFYDIGFSLDNLVKEVNSAKHQLGTLGGGNHFIELQKGSDGFVWIMIHSGSRNIGYKIAKYYHDLAKGLCGFWFSNIPTPDLSFIPQDDRAFDMYVDAMRWSMSFAKENRYRMMLAVRNIIVDLFPGVEFDSEHAYDVHHNYARIENHFGQNVWVHRKGATSAREGEIGIIPGSQGTKSYIVRGLGNPQSFMSCSHGAGRKMGRKDAQRRLVLDDEVRRMDDLGIIHSVRHISDLDEAPGAYKDIDVVMDNQKDLVEIEVELTPLAVVKG